MKIPQQEVPIRILQLLHKAANNRTEEIRFTDDDQVTAAKLLATVDPQPERVLSFFPKPIAARARLELALHENTTHKINKVATILRNILISLNGTVPNKKKLTTPFDNYLEYAEGVVSFRDVTRDDIYSYFRNNGLPFGNLHETDIRHLELADAIFSCLANLHEKGLGSTMNFDHLKASIRTDHKHYSLVKNGVNMDARIDDIKALIERAKKIVGLSPVSE